MELGTFVANFANAMAVVDAFGPRAANQRSGVIFQPGIGPHSESETVRLVTQRLSNLDSTINYALNEPYPSSSRQRCDLCVGTNGDWEWAVEIKMLRLLGDNGKLNDNMLMHILSPYAQHRSALTDCTKLLTSGFTCRMAICIFAYEAPNWPTALVIEAFEVLASQQEKLGPRIESDVIRLIHPVHQAAQVFAWELTTL
jgi:hypothetical protein